MCSFDHFEKKIVPLIFMFYGFVIRSLLRVCANAFSMLSHIIDRAHYHIHRKTKMCMQRVEKEAKKKPFNRQYTTHYPIPALLNMEFVVISVICVVYSYSIEYVQQNEVNEKRLNNRMNEYIKLEHRFGLCILF